MVSRQYRLGTIASAGSRRAKIGNGARPRECRHRSYLIIGTYPKIAVLRSVIIPPLGGDTIWSNTAAAYLELPPPLQRLANELWAVHSNAFDYTAMARASEADAKHFDEVYTRTIYETEPPVVRVHPETGERTLVLGDVVQRFCWYPEV